MTTACTQSSGFIFIIGEGLGIREKTVQAALQQVGISTQTVNNPAETFSLLLDSRTISRENIAQPVRMIFVCTRRVARAALLYTRATLLYARAALLYATEC